MFQIPPRASVTLATARCQLAPLGPSDAAELQNAVRANRAFWERWVPLLALLESLTDCERYAVACEEAWQAGASLRFTVRSLQNGALLGVASLDHLSPTNLSASWGVWLRQASCGQGLGAEVTREVARWAFRTLGAHRLAATPRVDNLPSIALARRLGFREDGRVSDGEYVGGRWHDQVLFSLLSTMPGAS